MLDYFQAFVLVPELQGEGVMGRGYTFFLLKTASNGCPEWLCAWGGGPLIDYPCGGGVPAHRLVDHVISRWVGRCKLFYGFSRLVAFYPGRVAIWGVSFEVVFGK